MEYITHNRFKGIGIGGYFNLAYGTICAESQGMIYAPDGRCICAVTSENGWEHFHPNTPEGHSRQYMLEQLYKYYSKGAHSSDFSPEMWPNATNLYWKNLLRTMPTSDLEVYYRARLGEPKP